MTDVILQDPAQTTLETLNGTMRSFRSFKGGRIGVCTVSVGDEIITCQTSRAGQVAELEAAYLHQAQSHSEPQLTLRGARKLVQFSGRQSELFDIRDVSIA